MSDSSGRSGEFSRGELAFYVVLALAAAAAFAFGLTVAQHDTGVIAVYAGGAPSDASVFCAVPVGVVVAVVGLLTFAVRRLSRAQGESDIESLRQDGD